MITRALTSASTSMVVTLALLFGMHLLIATGQTIITEPRDRHMLDWVRVVREEDLQVEETILPPIDKPPIPPPATIPETAPSGVTGVGFTVAPPAPPTERTTIGGFGLSDGPLVNIIKVQPRYPVAAQTRGLEGTVIVQFDVTPQGVVENVVVVESSNSIFNKAAIEAAYRFKYRPKVVDGTSYGERGLRQLFRFDMED